MGNEQEKIEIPQVVYQGKDKKLKERVTKFKAGTFRIVVFTAVGLVMGSLSHTQYYKDDPFWPTRIISMLPHKLTEVIYFLFGVEMTEYVALASENISTPWGWELGVFPHSYIAALLAEVVTPVLAGGAVYGLLAYFTGDRRVFTFGRFLKFVGCWCAVLLLLVGAAKGINAKAVADNERLVGEVYDIEVYRERDPVTDLYFNGDFFYKDPALGILKENLFSGLEALDESEVAREKEGELPVVILFNESTSPRGGVYWVNYAGRYLATEKGRIYRISEGFARIMRDYVEDGMLPEVE